MKDIRPIFSRRAALVGAGSLLLSGHIPARAQNSPIRMFVPFPAGTGTDMTARAFAKALGDLSKRPVVVDNRAGANGTIAIQAMLQAPADGSAVFLGSNSTLSTNAALFRSLPYDPLKDLAPISVIARAPCVVVVSPQSRFGSLAALLAHARQQPGALNYGAGSPSYSLYTEWLNEMAGIRAAGIPYKGTTEVMTAVAGGLLDYAVIDSTAAQKLIQGGRLRALAITDEQRSKALPDVPTVAEVGLPKFLAFNWTAAAVSAKTPDKAVQSLQELFARAAKAPEVVQLFESLAITPWMSTSAEMRRFQSEEIERWKRLAVETKLQVD